MFFDGKVGAKRNVSLRGNTVKSKEDLMKESQKLREQRDVERRKHQQVTKIQRNVRRFLVGLRYSRLAFQGLYDEFHGNDISINHILDGLHKFTFFYRYYLRHESYANLLGMKLEATRCQEIREKLLEMLQNSILTHQILIWKGISSSTVCDDSFSSLLTTSPSLLQSSFDLRVFRIGKFFTITLKHAMDSTITSQTKIQCIRFLQYIFRPVLELSESNSDDIKWGLAAVVLRFCDVLTKELEKSTLTIASGDDELCRIIVEKIVAIVLSMDSYPPGLRVLGENATRIAIVNLLSIPDVISKKHFHSLVLNLLKNNSYNDWQRIFEELSIIQISSSRNVVNHNWNLDNKKRMEFMVNIAIAFREGLLVANNEDAVPMASLLVRGLNTSFCMDEPSVLSLLQSLRNREFPGVSTGAPMEVEGIESFPVTNLLAELVTSEVYSDYRMADGFKKIDYRIALLQYGILSNTRWSNSAGQDYTAFIELLLQNNRNYHREDLLVKMFDLHFPFDYSYIGQFGDVTTQSALISLVAQLLSISPVVISYQRSNMNESSLKSSDLKSKILKSLAFTQSLHQPNSINNGLATCKVSLIRRLWQFLHKFFGKSTLDLLVSVEEKTFLCHVEISNLGTKWNMTPTSLYKLMLETIYLLTSIFQYSLSAIDDDELLQEERILSKDELKSLFLFLRQFMFRFYWIDAICIIGSQFLFPSPSECSLFNLLKHQVLLTSTALFHQLSIRNERRLFLDSLETVQWSVQWTNQEFQLIDSSSTFLTSGITGNASSTISSQVVAYAEELEEENASFSLRNPLMKTILTFIPQVIPFTQRVQLLHSLIEKDRIQYYDASGSSFLFNQAPEHIEIRRDHLVQDAVDKLYPIGQKMKGRVQIQFISAQGFTEAGIDGGGLFKEFMDVFAKTVCDPSYGLFVVTSSQQLVPNPASKILGEGHLKLFEFVGRIIGKAMYEKLLFESELSPGFLNILLGRSNQLDDLIHLDSSLYRSLMDMKRRANNGEDISEYGLHFEYSHDVYGKPVTEDIKTNGSGIPVTNSNLREYILLLANYKQNLMIRNQCRAFIRGFRDMIPLDWIRMFHVHELQLVIGGDQRKIDVQDMKRNTAYHGYAENEGYIQWFWKIIEEMDVEDQSNLLRFITSCPRQPLLGFGQLHPKLGIQKVDQFEYGSNMSASTGRERQNAAKLPTAATCMNLLKLPRYDSEDVLREKLLYAIRSKSGFELS